MGSGHSKLRIAVSNCSMNRDMRTSFTRPGALSGGSGGLICPTGGVLQRPSGRSAFRRRSSLARSPGAVPKAWLALLCCALASFRCDARLNVVATTPDLGSIASAVGGNKIDVTVLVRPTEDPHFVDPKPSFVVKLNRADVLIEGGAELELGWLPSLLQSARNSKIAKGAPGRVVANEGIKMLEVPVSLDRSKGDIHAAGNPHYLVDPENALIVARHIARALAAVDPESSAAYESNLAEFTASLQTALQEWKRKLEPFRGRSLVGFHNSWPYFANRFEFKIDIYLEPKPGVPPTPAHLAEVITTMKERRAAVILVDTYQDRRTAEAVASRTGATVLDVSHFPGGMKGTEAGYIAFMNRLVDSLATALAAKAD